jgi:protein SCO1/2
MPILKTAIHFSLLLVLLGSVSLSRADSAPTSATASRLKVYYNAPSFTLTDERGELFDSQQLAGKFWIASFFFSSCQGPCPLTMARLARLVRSLSPESAVEFVSISVDPERDTPAVLQEYAKGLRPVGARWHFLTGEKKEITELLKAGFKVGAGPSLDIHSTSFVLVDTLGRVRGYYSGLRDEDSVRLTSELDLLTRERE